ncbi:hypothetical protein MANES_04G055776v8 [Manihot esculenta]|uniref:Uncharacterized protein n=1 Tax=Manihot esculenta TaxID=3983 RepID=A0ACB7HSC8_MANES|nr:hypothetical protein MANES_04G055776v8 [Manihot esculenta]
MRCGGTFGCRKVVCQPYIRAPWPKRVEFGG